MGGRGGGATVQVFDEVEAGGCQYVLGAEVEFGVGAYTVYEGLKFVKVIDGTAMTGGELVVEGELLSVGLRGSRCGLGEIQWFNAMNIYISMHFTLNKPIYLHVNV